MIRDQIFRARGWAAVAVTAAVASRTGHKF
jgi:hypothetical protein